jgi:hypothetical protein
MNCTRCFRDIESGAVECFGTLYHARCAPKNVRGARRVMTPPRGEVAPMPRLPALSSPATLPTVPCPPPEACPESYCIDCVKPSRECACEEHP